MMSDVGRDVLRDSGGSKLSSKIYWSTGRYRPKYLGRVGQHDPSCGSLSLESLIPIVIAFLEHTSHNRSGIVSSSSHNLGSFKSPECLFCYQAIDYFLTSQICPVIYPRVAFWLLFKVSFNYM